MTKNFLADMSANVCQKEVILLENKYTVYLKEVPTRIAPGGRVLATTVRAFIKKNEEVVTMEKGDYHDNKPKNIAFE